MEKTQRKFKVQFEQYAYGFSNKKCHFVFNYNDLAHSRHKNRHEEYTSSSNSQLCLPHESISSQMGSFNEYYVLS